MKKEVKRVAITGGTGQIAYNLLFRIAHGDVFGPSQPVILNIYDLPDTHKVLEALVMELEDCAFPLLQGVNVGSNPFQIFEDIDIALLIGSKPRGPGMERSDLLLENGKIFVEEGKALNEVAKRNCKVFVVGNPCNTNCLIAMHYASNIPRKNFHAMMRLDQNRAQAILAKKAGVSVDQVTCMTIWGNHSTTQVPDFTHARISGKRCEEVIQDSDWLQRDFLDLVQKRGAQVIQARGKSSAGSAANALIDAVRSLYIPTPKGEWFTSAVCTDGNHYGIEENLIFGFPCRSKGDGDYEIVTNLEWNFMIKEKIAITQKELLSERECVRNLLIK